MIEKNKVENSLTTVDGDDVSEDDYDDDEYASSKRAKYLDPDACMFCEFAPCLWVQYTEGLMFDADYFSSSQGYENDSTYHHLIRKHLYRRFTSIHHGIGNPRIPIPDCVVDKIRLLYPEPHDNNYMGFKANSIRGRDISSRAFLFFRCHTRCQHLDQHLKV